MLGLCQMIERIEVQYLFLLIACGGKNGRTTYLRSYDKQFHAATIDSAIHQRPIAKLADPQE